MKKTFFKVGITIIILLVVIIIVLSKYYEYKEKVSKIKEFNVEYEKCLDGEIYGTELANLINKAIDDNERNFVKKDKQGVYIKDDTNSVTIDVRITDLEEKPVYKMETFYNSGNGMTDFIQYYNIVKFKCAKAEYNKTGKISYMLFEQIEE